MARIEIDYNLKNLGYTFQVFSACCQKVDIYGSGSFSLWKLTLCLPFDVQR